MVDIGHDYTQVTEATDESLEFGCRGCTPLQDGVDVGVPSFVLVVW